MAKKKINHISKNSEKFLEKYLNTASPTGFESEGQKVWLDYIKPYIDSYIVDTYGSVVGVINPEAKYKVVIEAHADEISWFVHYISEKGLSFDIACTGIRKEDIELLIQDNLLKINYSKPKEDIKEIEYIHKGIAKRSFNLGWKIDSKFDLTKATASFNDGLLAIQVPFSKGSELKKLQIK